MVSRNESPVKSMWYFSLSQFANSFPRTTFNPSLKRIGGRSFPFFFESWRGHFYKHEYTSPSSLMSTARRAYRQSITDRKSVTSDNDGLITRKRSFTSTGPPLSSVSTLGTKSRVLVGAVDPADCSSLLNNHL